MIYHPAEDSYLLERQVKKYAKNKSVLDLGSGSGILAEASIKAKAKSVLASDINPESINVLKKKKIPAIRSNLFSKIKGKFDLIVFNPPYLPQDSLEDKESSTITSGGKRGDELILKFLKQAKSHLNNNGIILLLVSSLTPLDKIKILLKERNLHYRVIAEQKLFFEKLQVWEIKLKDY